MIPVPTLTGVSLDSALGRAHCILIRTHVTVLGCTMRMAELPLCLPRHEEVDRDGLPGIVRSPSNQYTRLPSRLAFDQIPGEVHHLDTLVQLPDLTGKIVGLAPQVGDVHLWHVPQLAPQRSPGVAPVVPLIRAVG